MKALFIKVFLIVFTTISCLSATAALVSWRYASLGDARGDNAQYTNWGEQALDALGDGGLSAFTQVIETIEQQESISLYLLAPDGYPIGQQPDPQLISAIQHREFLPPHRNPIGPFAARAVTLSYIEGDYRLIVLFSSRSRLFKPLGVLMIAIGAIGIAAFLTTWHITHPLRQLKYSARAFAQGRLNDQVAPSVLQRRDVIGELGQEFQTMAKRLGDLLQAQRELMRNISHELRTPLARLEIAKTLAQNHDPDNRHLQRIELETQRLDRLIGDVLAISRLQSGAEHLQRERHALNPLLMQIAEDACYEYEDEHRRAELIAQEETIDADIDADKFASAIENIVRNAMRYTPDHGCVRLHLSQTPQQIRLVISDTGPGVSETALPQLFVPFFRENPQQSEGSGYGIGLAIAKGVVDLHQGQIEAKNLTPHGLSVTVTLPR